MRRDGVECLRYPSARDRAGGLNVAADAFMSQSYIGVNAGLVLVVCDDPGIHSSQNEQDTRLFARMAMVPILEPADAQEPESHDQE